MKRLQTDLKDSIYEEFSENCEMEGRSKSDVVRVLILEWNRDRRVERARDLKRRESTDE